MPQPQHLVSPDLCTSVHLLLSLHLPLPTLPSILLIFFFNATATTEIYTLSLHDALPIYSSHGNRLCCDWSPMGCCTRFRGSYRSEEHTSELQSHSDLVCRLLLEKKNTTRKRSSAVLEYRS